MHVLMDSNLYYSTKDGQHHFGHGCLKQKCCRTKTCILVGEGRNVGRLVGEEGGEAGEKMASWEPGEAQNKEGIRLLGRKRYKKEGMMVVRLKEGSPHYGNLVCSLAPIRDLHISLL